MWFNRNNSDSNFKILLDHHSQEMFALRQQIRFLESDNARLADDYKKMADKIIQVDILDRETKALKAQQEEFEKIKAAKEIE